VELLSTASGPGAETDGGELQGHARDQGVSRPGCQLTPRPQREEVLSTVAVDSDFPVTVTLGRTDLASMQGI
jgi:hypothetical protein